MAKRKIIKIDEARCNGCGLCIPNCPEGALKVIDGKVRLVSDLFCDGLGACLGKCPQGAISVEERDAAEYDEKKVMANIVKQGRNVVRAHLEHLKLHNENGLLQEAIEYLKRKGIANPLNEEAAPGGHAHGPCGCPGSAERDLREKTAPVKQKASSGRQSSELLHWPVQIKLVSPLASFLHGADLLIAADCVPFAYANFHQDLLKGKVLLVGCPKLDDIELYREKIGQIVENNAIKSITYAHMEVPCCFGLVSVIQSILAKTGRHIPFKEITISIKGEKL